MYIENYLLRTTSLVLNRSPTTPITPLPRCGKYIELRWTCEVTLPSQEVKTERNNAI